MKKYTVKMTALLAALALLTACGSTPSAQESTIPETSVSAAEAAPVVSVASSTEEAGSASSVEEVGTGIVFDEIDLQDAVTGLTDPYVLQGSGNVDYLFGVVYDGALIAAIQYDDSLVDLETPGEYPLTYTVYVYRDALDAYLGGTYDPSQDYSQSAIVTVVIEKTATVCTPEDAAALADAETYVLSDNGTTVPASDGTQLPEVQPETPRSIETTGGMVVSASEIDPAELPALEAAAAETQMETAQAAVSGQPTATGTGTTAATATPTPSSTAKPASTTTPTATPKPSTTTTPTATPKPSATATPKPSATTTPTTTPKPSPTPTPHTHTWVSVAATGHYEQVQTGTVHHDAVTHEEYTYRTVYQCNSCGYTCYDGVTIADHIVFGDCGAGYSQWAEKTGSYTVTDQAAWDEPVYSNVWVEDSAAYEYCSGCGQTR